MLQARLTKTCEAKLRTTQYGFRAQRSTIHPIFVLRRAMEWSNMTSRPLNLLFLDWKQAFDSLDHTAMMSALERFGLPPNICKLIASLYESPTFTVQGRSDHTALGTVSSGIRQGCPLSPYLFIIVLSVIFQDLDARLLEKGIPTNTWSEGNPIYDLEYADDTLLLSLTTPQLQNFLRELEEEAQLYGMRLNTEKTELLSRPDHTATLYFHNGDPVPTTTTAKYLGTLISWQKPADTALGHRAALAETAYKKLRLVWNSNLNRPKKVKLFHATIVPVLLYGLDTLTLTDKFLHKVDAAYYRLLRRCIGIKASYYSRISNLEVWKQAGEPTPPSKTLNAKQKDFLGTVFAAKPTDPIHNIVFCSAFKDRIISQGRRRGRKCPYWLEVVTSRHYPNIWNHHNALFGVHFKYVTLSRLLRGAPEKAPKRAHRSCARP